MSKQITDEEAKEAGVNKDVFQMWSDVMQALWTAAIATYGITKKDELFPRNEKTKYSLVRNSESTPTYVTTNSLKPISSWAKLN